jgi:hypothetical protein
VTGAEDSVQMVVQDCGGGLRASLADEDAGAEPRGHGKQADRLQPCVRTGMEQSRLPRLAEQSGQGVFGGIGVADERLGRERPVAHGQNRV